MVAEPHRDDPIDPNATDPFAQEVVDEPGIDTLTDPVDDGAAAPVAADADATQAEMDATAEREEQLTRLFTATVLGTGDERIGKVGQVYLDDQTQEPNWITVRTGLFGTKEFFIPLDEAQLDGKHIMVPYSKDQVTSAPSTEIDQNLSPDEEDALYNHYRVPGRMTNADAEAATLAPTTEETELVAAETSAADEPAGDGVLGGLAQERPSAGGGAAAGTAAAGAAAGAAAWGAPLAEHGDSPQAEATSPASASASASASDDARTAFDEDATQAVATPAAAQQPSFAEESFAQETSTWSLAGDAADAADAQDATAADAPATNDAPVTNDAPEAKKSTEEETGSFGIEALFANLADDDEERPGDADDFSAFRRPGQ